MHRFLHKALITAAVPRRVLLMELVRSRVSWDAATIRRYQERALRQLIPYCWEHVPYYRRHWQGHIRGPEEIRSIEDLQKLPILTKDAVRSEGEALVSRAPGVRGEVARTGGSTGRPMAFQMTWHDEQMTWAQMYVGWSWAGYRLGDPFLVVGGESIGVGLGDRRTRKDWIMNRWVTSGSNLTLERAEALIASPHWPEIRFIYGYPNSIRELCEHLATLKARPKALRGVMCTAEVMRPEVRARIQEVLGVERVHDQYGLNDGGLLACESQDRDGLHVHFHRALLEILDEDDRQITELDRPGRSIATSFSNLAQPFVRYETGDQVHWKSYQAAPSGIAWPRIGPVDGRTGDVIYTPGGRSIPMPGLTLVMRWIEGLKSYQFIQTEADRVTVRLEGEAGFSMSEERLQAYLKERIADEMHWEIRFGPPELTANGKLLVIRNDWLRRLGLSRPPRAGVDLSQRP